MNINRQIKVKTSFDATHCWPSAPEQVAFLRHPHRHNFQITAVLTVYHDDRDLEFFIVKDAIDSYCGERFNKKDLGPMSCETIAEMIGNKLNVLYEDRVDWIEVSEDGMNSAVVTFRTNHGKTDDFSIQRTV